MNTTERAIRAVILQWHLAYWQKLVRGEAA